jgi:hypothetical protein
MFLAQSTGEEANTMNQKMRTTTTLKTNFHKIPDFWNFFVEKQAMDSYFHTLIL